MPAPVRPESPAIAQLEAARRRLLPQVETAIQTFLNRWNPPSGAASPPGEATMPAAGAPPAEAQAARLTHHLSPNAPDHYGMMRYHLGWADAALKPVAAPTGKRLRPLICLLAAEACGATSEGAMPAAVALELLHNFTLIHDDIEDGDPIRHHQPTVWKLWGEPQAINAGDGMHVLAHLALLDLGKDGQVPDRVVVEAAWRLAETSLIITEGQHLDLAFEQRAAVTPDEYLDMIARKSASLLSCAPALGAAIAGAPDDVVEALASFGFDLGMGFQVRDDILGIWGRSETTGKPAGDLRRRKKTLPALYAIERGDAADRAVLDALFASPAPDEAQIRRALDVLERRGARTYCETAVARYSESARAHLAAVEPSPARDALAALAVQLERRER